MLPDGLSSNGWALSHAGAMEKYADEERRARAAELGLWRGGFVPPDYWRLRDDQQGCSVCAARKQRLKKGNTVE